MICHLKKDTNTAPHLEGCNRQQTWRYCFNNPHIAKITTSYKKRSPTNTQVNTTQANTLKTKHRHTTTTDKHQLTSRRPNLTMPKNSVLLPIFQVKQLWHNTKTAHGSIRVYLPSVILYTLTFGYIDFLHQIPFYPLQISTIHKPKLQSS